MSHHKINYLELPARDLELNKTFFQTVFGWSFVDYGPDYCAINDAGLDGGFYRADMTSDTRTGAALAVLFSDDLEQTQASVEAAGGQILQSIFDFPGGRRFHLADPCGNEWAVWSDKDAEGNKIGEG